MQEYVAIFTKK